MNAGAVCDYISSWLTDYARTSFTNGFVIGISGGIDSAVTSTLAAKTGLPLLCVQMPIHQHKDQVSRAEKHIEWLKSNFENVEALVTDLTPVFDQMVSAFPAVQNEEDRWMSLANTRARLRMTTLYYYAALNRQLVLGTGNKIEDFGIGFYTKYGDGGVDLSPIADLMKSEVFELAKHLAIVEDIQNAAPTDGLWGDDRTDEDQIGATYNELEWAMNCYNTITDQEVEQLTDRKRKVLGIFNRLNKMNQHKMIPIPICEIPTEIK